MTPFYGWGSAASRTQSHFKEAVYFLPLVFPIEKTILQKCLIKKNQVRLIHYFLLSEFCSYWQFENVSLRNYILVCFEKNDQLPNQPSIAMMQKLAHWYSLLINRLVTIWWQIVLKWGKWNSWKSRWSFKVRPRGKLFPVDAQSDHA